VKVLEFRDRFLLTLSVHAGSQNREMDWPAWDALRRALFELIGEAGDEARCPHADALYQGRCCLLCGRTPNASNTLSPETT
jgi:hypothetical protein